MRVIYVTCMSYPYFLKPSNPNDAPCVCTDAAHFISEFLFLHLKINYKTNAPYFEIYI